MLTLTISDDRCCARFRKCGLNPDLAVCLLCDKLDCSMHDEVSSEEEAAEMRMRGDIHFGRRDFVWLCPFDKSPCDVVDMCWSVGCLDDGYSVKKECSQTTSIGYIRGNMMRRKLIPFIKAVGKGRFCHFDVSLVCGGDFENCAALGVGLGVWIGLCPHFKIS